MTIRELIDTLQLYGDRYGYDLTVCNGKGEEFDNELTFAPTNNNKLLLLTPEEDDEYEYLTQL